MHPIDSPSSPAPLAAPSLRSLQFARALAVLGVVIYHAHGVMQKRANTLGLDGLFWTTETAAIKIGAIGVDIFFVISGFIIYFTTAARSTPISRREFYLARVIRIYPIWWVALAAMAVLSALPGTSGSFTLPELLRSFFLWPYIDAENEVKPLLPIGWTLHFELLFYAVFGLLLGLPRMARLWACTALFGVTVLAGSFFSPGDWPLLRLLASPKTLEFVAGCWLAEAYLRGLRFGGRLGWPLLLTAGALVIGFATSQTAWQDNSVAFRLPLAVITIAMLTLWRGVDQQSWHPLALFVGDASYAIYLFHMFPVMLISGLWKRGLLVPPASWPPELTWALVALAGLLAGAVMHLLVEKPLLLRLRQRLASKRTAPAAVPPAAPVT